MQSFYKSILIAMFISLSSLSFAQEGIVDGPTSAVQNETKTYTFNNGFLVIAASWEVTGGIVLSQSQNGTTYTASIKWTTISSSNVVKFKRKFTVLSQILVRVAAPIPTLNAGSISGGGTYCIGSSVTLSNSSSASGGTGSYSYQWQWYMFNTWADVTTSGDTGSSYTFTNKANLYRRKVTSGTQVAYSNSKQVNTFSPLKAGSIAGEKTICSASSGGTLTNSSSGSGGSGTAIYVWQKSSNNSSWSNVSGNSNSTSYSPGSVSNTTYYRRGFKNSCSSSYLYTSSVKITVKAQMAPPIKFPLSQSNCGPQSVTLKVKASTDPFDVFTWYSTQSGGSALGTGLVYTTGVISATKTYYVSVHNETGPLCESNRTAVTATILPVLNPGSIGGNQNVCYGSTPSQTLSSVSGASGGSGGIVYQWQVSSTGTSGWLNIVTNGNGSSYSIPSSLTQDKYYQRRATSGQCTEYSNSVLVNVYNGLSAGYISGNQTICPGSANTLTNSSSGSGGSGTAIYVWQKSSNNSSWSNVSGNSNSTSYSPGSVSNTTYYRRGFKNSCSSSFIYTSPSVKIDVLDQMLAPIANNNSRCGNGVIYLSVKQGIDPNDSYTWYADQNGGVALGIGPSFSTPISTTTTYYVSVHNETLIECESNRTPVTATFYPTLNPGSINGAQDVCNAEIPSQPLANVSNASGGNGNLNYVWQKSTTGTSGWSNILNETGTSFTIPEAISTDMYYRRKVVSGNCIAFTSNVKVNLQPIPIGSAGSDLEVFDYNSIILSGQSPTGGNWSGSFVSSNTFDAKNAGVGSYVVDYNFNDPVTGCSGSDSRLINVIKSPSLAATNTIPDSNGNYIDLSVFSGFSSYQWYRDGNPISGATSYTYKATLSGSYTTFVTIGNDSFTTPARVIKIIEPSKAKNYVLTKTYLKGSTDPNLVSEDDILFKATYYDGLGRVTQTVDIAQSPAGHDIVQPIVYDEFGRSPIEYLPYVESEAYGSFRSSAIDKNDYTLSSQYLFYNDPSTDISVDQKPYSESFYDETPLNRVTEQYGPGEDWRTNLKSNKIKYESNLSSDNVKIWTVENNMPVTVANFSTGKLSKTITIDEEGHQVQEFVDKIGRTVLTRAEAPNSEWADTYYVFDDLGNLRFVLPPEASKNATGSPDATFLKKLAFQYAYDGRKRMIEKQVPGAGVVYMVYDNGNRLVLTQDANQRVDFKWSYTKYDAFDRPIMTGIYTHSSEVDQPTMTGLISTTNYYEKYDGSATDGYSNTVWPTTDLNLHTITFYDSYAFMGVGAIWEGTNWEYDKDQFDNSSYPDEEFKFVRGQVTGTKVKYFNGTSMAWLQTVSYYDNKNRPIQIIADNHLGGTDRVFSIYDFVGKVLESKTVHHDDSKSTVISNKIEYDQVGRHKATEYQLKRQVDWANTIGMIEDGSSLTKNISTGWNAGSSSKNVLLKDEDGGMETTIQLMNKRIMIGLTEVDENQHYNSIDYALYTYIDGTLRVYENGAHRKNGGAYNQGDKIAVERIDEIIYYKKNDIVFHTSTVENNTNLIVDFSAYDGGSIVDDVFMYQQPTILSTSSYNEIGELIEKNLHGIPETGNPGVTTYAQSIDYNYNIRGWLTDINDVDLADGESDYFGMELAYNSGFTGLTSTNSFNGNISAIKWTAGVSGTNAQAYTFEYDELNRISSATSKKKDVVWLPGSTDMAVGQYDLNGNIKALTRNTFGTTGIPATMDNLTYDYTDSGNQLQYVTDGGDDSKGFIDGNTTGNDYDYDANGNLTEDKNKDISLIEYNHLNLPTKVTKNDGQYILYTYDMAGSKLAQEVYDASDALQKRSDYSGAFIYESTGTEASELQFIQTAEGRIVTAASTEYQYHLKDHLGNTRVTFTTNDNVDTFEATMESEYAAHEEASFSNIAESRKLDQIFNHTLADGTVTSPDNSAMLNSVTTQIIGPAKSIRVAPGDVIDMEAYGQYINYNGNGSKVAANTVLAAIAGAFTPVGATTEVMQQVVDQFASAGAGALSPGANTDAPAAFLNYLLFDNDFQLIEPMGFAGVSTNANGSFEKLVIPTVEIKEAGYIYIYVSNEDAANVNVYFDDLKITHTKSKIVQMDDYYPFGLTFNSFKREDSKANDFLFAGKERQDDLDLNWFDFGARMYAPDIGRWNGVDASAENYVNQSPYHYSGNNPILFVDFDGNDYGIKVNRGNKTITIKAHFLTSSKSSTAFKERGSGRWNAQSGKNTFVAGGIRSLKKSLKSGGTGEAYKVNVSVTSEVLDGESKVNGRVVESNTPRDAAANADASGTVNSFDTVKEFPMNENQNGGTSNNQVDVKANKLNSGTTTHETSHAMGNGHTDQGGTLNPTGGESVGRSNIAETLAGVGIGGDTSARNASGGTGDGTLLGGSSNTGLGQGKLISTKRYNRIVRRIDRKQGE